MRIIAQGMARRGRALHLAGAWSGLRGWARRAAGALPSDCPLCAMAAQGGNLCAGCVDDILADRQGRPGSGPHGLDSERRRCPRCWLMLVPGSAACPDCAAHPPAFQRTVCAFDYAPPADALVWQLKGGLRLARAALLARMLARAVHQAAPALPRPVVLVPIPASPASLRRRGFNPANEIAQALGRELGLPVAGWLERTRGGGRQTHLDRRARRLGAHELYRCRVPASGCIAVVDDVMTTGSTMDSAARALLAAGADGVLALAAARTPYPAGGGRNMPARQPFRPYSL